MALAHQSIATIKSPEFINLQPLDINPLMSSCEIKVLYIGKNRNGTFISKETAQEMAKTLRGAPIVGYYKQDKEDFADHGEQIIFDGDGIHFNCLTVPYGFVSPNAQVWFKDFEQSDDFGNNIIRTYLMTTGYLWTEQFKEAKKIFEDNGKPHSMELDEKSLQGHWSTDIKDQMDFFIINDAIFSKLCILGDDVEPCFEGSAVTAPQVSASFTLDDNFKHNLFEMMQELTYALKGGNTVAKIEDKTLEVESTEGLEQGSVDYTENNQVNIEESSSDENTTEAKDIDPAFEKKEPEEDKSDSKDTKEDADEEDNNASDDKKDEDEEEKKYTALSEKYTELQKEYEQLKDENAELRQFKENIQNKQKDELIDQFYMLSDEDKKDVIENKANYTFEEIQSKLAVICFKKKVNFNLEDSSENNNNQEEKIEKPVTTFNIENVADSVPDWVKEVEMTMKNKD